MSKQDLSRGELWFFGLLAAALGVVMFAGQNPATLKAPVAAGTPLPELMASGWLNAEKIPSRESLSGKVVVIDCWATWCPPCRAAMPDLAKLYAKYQPLGVEFIGITPQSASERSQIEQFMQTIPGFDWAVGYGGGPTIGMLGIQAYPTVIVFNAKGIATWSSTRLRGIEIALDEALAMVAE